MAISSFNGGFPGMAGAPVQAALATNYIDFTATGNGWAQQYLPDLMEKEAEVYGKRTIGGFLAQVGAEEAMSADQVIWTEQGRLHLAYDGVIGGTASNGNVTIEADANGVTQGANHGIRVGDTVLMASATTTMRGYVKTADANDATINVLPYGAANLSTYFGNTDDVRILVYGSEVKKASTKRDRGNKPQHKSLTNKPIILRDYYEISGSDQAQIGWVEVSGEEGQSGYYWYVKAEAETRSRFADHLEMTMLEAEQAHANSVVENELTAANDSAGTQGLFDAILKRGHVTTGVTGVNAATDLAEFDAILAKFDENGAIEENMMFVNRATALAMDDMLASMNSYGAGGTSYGVFNNSEDMALNLGFSGFRRGSYDFYKSDWKYLNDKGTRGLITGFAADAIRGAIIPAGVSSVYDEVMGKNMKRPFLHVRYRASQTESRKMKSWVTGSVGAVTSDLDAMEIHYLSERCLVTQGANNFMLMK